MLAEEAEYLGDVQLASTCNILSQQVKQYFNYAAYVHLYMSLKEKEKELKKRNFFPHTYTSLNHTMELKTKNNNHGYAKVEGPRLEAINQINSKMKLANKSCFFVNLYDIEKNKSLKCLKDIDQNTFQILTNIKKNLDTKDMSAQFSKNSFSDNRKFPQNDQFVPLLHKIQYRKLWKANRWYPFLAKIAYDQQMITIYQNFMQMSKSEKNMSNLLMELSKRNCTRFLL
jgi:hypothetical protein